MQKLSVTVISDPHYYSKRNWAGGDPFQFAPKRDQLYKEGSEEILKHVFNEICQDNEEQIVLINGDLTNNGEITSHEEMRALLRTLQQKGKRVFVTTATHDYSDTGLSYGYDENNREVDVPALKREDLYAYYREFGINRALSVHMPSMCYTAQLADGYRLLALNDDHGKKHCGFTDDCFAWIEEQAALAKKEGQFLVAMTHHPLLAPSPLYKLIAPNDLLEDGDTRARQLADLGIPCIFTGHSHVQNIAKITTENGNVFYDVSTSAVTGYPPFYRHVTFDPESRTVTVRSTLVKNVPALKVGGETLPSFLKKQFLGTVEDILNSAENDYEKFADLAVGFSLAKETSYKLKPVIRPAARFLNRLTFGRVWKFAKKQSGVSRAEIAAIRQDPAVPYIIECVANLYRGDACMADPPGLNEDEKQKAALKFRAAVGLLKKLDQLTRPFSRVLQKHGVESISAVAMPLLQSQKPFGDSNAELKY